MLLNCLNMKKNLLILAAICLSLYTYGQTIVFHENFESPSLADSVLSQPANAWALSSKIAAHGQYSDTSVVIQGDTTRLITNTFSTTGLPFVMLEFWHICKIEFNDGAEIFVSANNGVSWTKLGAQHYHGGGFFSLMGEKFTAATYVDWQAAVPAAQPDNTWWKKELFNISSIAGNQSQVKVMFLLRDGNNTGAVGNYGWLVDDIRVTASTAELFPPVLSFIPPVLKDSVFNFGPFPIYVSAFDSSGIDTVQLFYSRNHAPYQTAGMIYNSGTQYFTFIDTVPAFSLLDTVDYYVIAKDNSASHNTTRIPELGTNRFVIYPPQPPPGCSAPITTFPFIESFDSWNNGSTSCGATYMAPAGWSNIIEPLNGTDWVAYSGTTPTTNTGPTADHTSGTGKYVFVESSSCNAREAQLLTPCMNITGVDAPTLEFWYHMWGTTMGELHVDIWLGNKWELDIMPPIIGNKGDQWYKVEVNLTPYKGVTQIRFRAITGTGGFSDIAIDDVKVWQPPRNDAGIVALNYPVSPASTGNLPVHASIRNFGSANLTKVKVQYSVNGLVQPVFQWTGLLPPGTQSDSVQIGNYNFPAGPATVRIWTFEPNDSLDGFNQNDTLLKTIISCSSPLRGTFTVGGSNPNFTSLSDAIFALTSCGIDSAVVMRLAPGTYNQQLSFDSIPGASALNTITFESLTGDSTSVIISYNAVGLNDNWVVRLNGARYMRFNKLTFQGNLTTSYSRVVVIEGNSSYNHFTSCVIRSANIASSYAAGIYSALGVDEYNEFRKNHILDGYYGVYYYGTSALSEKGNVFDNNIIQGYRYYGLFMYYQDSVMVRNNTILHNSVASSIYPLYAYYCDGPIQITGNKVHSTANYNYGFRVYYCVSTLSNPGIVANNFVSSTGSSTSSYGIYTGYCTYVNFYHNSVNIHGNTGTSYAFYSVGSGNINVVNNSFVNKSKSYAYYISTTTAITTSNYNNIFSDSTQFAYWGGVRSNLAALKAVSGKDQNSMTVEPGYISNSDLHINLMNMVGAGTPLLQVPYDIDGDPRDPNAPTLGADEIEPVPIDAGIATIIEPAASVAEAAQVSLRVVIRNFGTNAITGGMPILYKLNNAAYTTFNYTGNIPTMSADTFVITTFTAPSGPNTICVKTQLTGDTNTFNDENCKNFYGIPQKDVGVVAMIAPDSGKCYSTNEQIIVQIKNYGSQVFNFAQNPVSIHVAVSGAVNMIIPPVTLNTGTLALGATMNVNVTNTFPMVISGLYTFNARTVCATDGDTTNNAMPARIMPVFATVNTLPFIESFENFTPGTGSYDPGTFNNGWSSTPNGNVYNYYQWRAWTGPTTTSGTGPAIDHTTGSGKFMYVEASYGTSGANAMLISPCIDLSQFTKPALSFYYHMFGINCHTLKIDVLYNGQWYLSVGSLAGQNQTSETDEWKQKIVDLSAFKGLIRFRFRATKGQADKGDMAIDDVKIFEPMPIDVGVSQFVQPNNFYSLAGQSQPIQIKVENFGFDTVKSMVIGYMAGNGIPVSYSWTGTLNPFQAITHTFQTPYSVQAGESPIKAFASSPGDGNISNDTLEIIFTGLPMIPVPYTDNFDGAGFWVASGGFRQWERGTPGGVNINTAYSPPNSWMTNLNANYLNNSADYLYTPFFNFSQVSGAIMRFRSNYDTQANSDAGMIQYSKDGGQTWSMLGYISVPGSTNWYNTNIGGTHCWSGSSNGWDETVYDLSEFDNEQDPVQFRFYFMSNTSINSYDGWAIDDFSITLPPVANDAGMTRILEPLTQPATGTTFYPKVRIMNYGTAVLSNIPLEFTVNNGTPVTGLWSGTLNPGDSTDYTFTTGASATGAFTICAQTNLIGDSYNFNNKVCRSYSTDVAVTHFYTPLSATVSGDTIPVVVRIDNLGSEVVTSFNIYFQLNVNTPVKEVWTGILQPKSFINYSFVNRYVSPVMTYQLCAYNSLPGDNNVFNDKLCKYVTGGVGIDETEESGLFLGAIRPNPATDFVQLPVFLKNENRLTVEVADIQGRKLIAVVKDYPAGEALIELNTSNLANGTYIYTVRGKEGLRSGILLIAR